MEYDQMSLYMYLYHMNDGGGMKVKEALGVQQILHEGSRFQGSPEKTVINWGSSRLPAEVRKCRVINRPEAIATSVNKLRAFETFLLHRVSCVPFTTNKGVAMQWLLDGHKVIARDRLEGHAGQGIRIIDPSALNLPVRNDLQAAWTYIASLLTGSVRPSYEVLGNARLWTRFTPYTREYRVHVVGNEAVNVRRKDLGTLNTMITDFQNPENVGDFVNVSIYPDEVTRQAVAATRAVGLDFAGVDVLWDGTNAYVLETNTAPGIGVPTARLYAAALRRLSNTT